MPNDRRNVAGMKKRPHTTEVISKNLRALMDLQKMSVSELAKASGVSPRMIQYVLDRERTPSVEIADDLGVALGVTGWLLMLHDLDYALAKSGRISDLIKNYMDDPDDTRAYLDSVAKRDARKP